MSKLLKGLSEDFDARMALRRKMLTHLDIHLSEAATVANRDDVRATLVGCSCCTSCNDCQLWLLWRRPSTPDACIAADAFLRLQAAAEAETRAHRRAG